MHTAEVSHCGRAPAAQLVVDYHALGFNGLVLTDHINHSTFRNLKKASWDEKITFYLTGYQIAQITAKALDPDFHVLLGAELRLDGCDNDYLLFGIDEAFLRGNPDLMKLSFDQLADRVHDAGFLLVQAHPFREKMTIVDWTKLDGVEAYNGNPDHESNNPITEAWADRHLLLRTSGNDYHGEFSAHLGGIRTAEPITCNADLLRVLRSGEYELNT